MSLIFQRIEGKISLTNYVLCREEDKEIVELKDLRQDDSIQLSLSELPLVLALLRKLFDVLVIRI